MIEGDKQMFCAHCGKEIPDDAAFCAFCGKETVKKNNLSDNEEKSSVVKEGYSDNRSDNKNVDSKTINRKALIAVIIGIAALCVVVGIAIFLNISGKATDESSNVESSAYNNDMSASESEQSDEKKDIPRLVIKSNQGSLFDDKSQKNYLECNYDTVYLDEESAKIYPELGKALSSYSSEILESQKQVVDKVRSDPNSVLILLEGHPFIDNKEIEIVRADRSVISIQRLQTVFYNGPHEYYTYECASFDSITGKKLELDDVIKSKSELFPVIKKYLVKNYHDDLINNPDDEIQSKWIDDAIEKANYNSKWLLTNEGIRIIYSEGELSSYSAGALFVELSFNEYPDLFTGLYTAGEGNVTSGSDSTPSVASHNNVIDIHNLEDGWYIAEFKTSSNELQQSESRHGKGMFYVENGMGSIRLSLTDVSVQKLFQGTAEDAKKAGAQLLDLKDQKTGNGIPVRTGSLTVPYLDKEFDCAVLEADGSWSDHKVMVSNPTTEGVTKMVATDGTYKIKYECKGNSQNGGITNALIITKNRNSDVKIEMGTNKFSKAVVGGKSINSVIENGRSTFTFPAVFDEVFSVKVTAVSEGKSYDEEYSLKLIWESLPKDVRGTRFDF